jgi:glycerophosphoryl diester phosphodiesterase
MDKKVTLTAHRGYRAKFPENTMLAFEEALKLDIDSIEMDVRMTKDNEIVVIHDATIDRTTNKKGLVREMTLEQVREADAGVKFGYEGVKIPTLEEFLALMSTRPDVRILLELKDYPEEVGAFAYASCEKTVQLCKKYGIWGKDRLSIITFSTGICAWLRHKHAGEDIAIHGFYPKQHMRGWDKDDPYKYYDEVCLFCDVFTMDGERIIPQNPVVAKSKFTQFALMDIKPCVYFSWSTNEEHYKEAFENGALGFTCDDPHECGKILDKLGARAYKTKD